MIATARGWRWLAQRGCVLLRLSLIAVFPVGCAVNITVIVPITFDNLSLRRRHGASVRAKTAGQFPTSQACATGIGTVKTPLSLGALALAIAGTTVSAKAECVVGVDFLRCLSTAFDVTERPKQRNETADQPAHLHHVAKHRKPQQGDEKAPPAKPPPALQ